MDTDWMVIQDKDGKVIYTQGKVPPEVLTSKPEDWKPLTENISYYKPDITSPLPVSVPNR